MDKLQQVEYAIFHWICGDCHNLPGIKINGSIDSDFFSEYPKSNGDYRDFATLFDRLKYDQCLSSDRALLLCSGGVDSSLLACLRRENFCNLRQGLLHTAYINHDNNDLYKFQNIVSECPSVAYVSALNGRAYMEGLEFLASKNFYQNTYGPTLAAALQDIPAGKYLMLVTGSGPDELFYGMEKYSWDDFEKLKDIPVVSALEKLDPRYNERSYLPLFNQEGTELYNEVLKKRRTLYTSISELNMDIFDSQRLLAYTTVTAQHMQLFNTISRIFQLDHRSPYLNHDLVQLALNTPLNYLVDPSLAKQVEIGKQYLKKYLSNYMRFDHVYGRKIGFHAPTSMYVMESGRQFFIQNVQYLPTWVDRDQAVSEINRRYDNNHAPDYFLYSLMNIIKQNQATSYED